MLLHQKTKGDQQLGDVPFVVKSLWSPVVKDIADYSLALKALGFRSEEPEP